MNLADLRLKVQDTGAFHTLDDYHAICREFLSFLDDEQPTRIVSPTVPNYIFFQYDEQFNHRITRPLNSDLLYESAEAFERAFLRFTDFLADLKRFQERATQQPGRDAYSTSGEINKVVYTVQQAIGAIGDSFDSPNQSRKRVGQLFEKLIRLIIAEVGVLCEPRTVKIPIPGFAGYSMSYELDLVFSRNKAILTAESAHIHPTEIVGSVKTTSKDRIDKIFLDKYLLSQLLQRHVPVVAIFLHDVQRASSRTREGGSSMFGVNSTFKRNHFLGYTVALNKLDGVYYVDPRPEMRKNQLLSEQIRDFQRFLIADLWSLSRNENNP
jgi:hypothetical protein